MILKQQKNWLPKKFRILYDLFETFGKVFLDTEFRNKKSKCEAVSFSGNLDNSFTMEIQKYKNSKARNLEGKIYFKLRSQPREFF